MFDIDLETLRLILAAAVVVNCFSMWLWFRGWRKCSKLSEHLSYAAGRLQELRYMVEGQQKTLP